MSSKLTDMIFFWMNQDRSWIFRQVIFYVSDLKRRYIRHRLKNINDILVILIQINSIQYFSQNIVYVQFIAGINDFSCCSYRHWIMECIPFIISWMMN